MEAQITGYLDMLSSLKDVPSAQKFKLRNDAALNMAGHLSRLQNRFAPTVFEEVYRAMKSIHQINSSKQTL